MKGYAITWAFDRSGPLYRQLYRHLAEEIRNGRLTAGERLPSKRQLCAHLDVSMSTVETAYEMLEAEGYIAAKPRSGFVVCDVLPLPAVEEQNARVPALPRKPEKRKFEYAFSTGAVDTSVFPFSSWARITKEAVYGRPDLLQLGHPQGDPSLRETLAQFLHQYRGVNCSPEQIVVGAGLDYLLGLVMQLLSPGAGVALEDPGYPSAHATVERFGRTPVYLPVDGDGMRPDLLEKSGASAALVTPSHQFPLGSTMPLSRRTQLLRWAGEEEDRWLLEDDYDSEFRYASRPIPAMQGLDKLGRVVYLGTFSRSIAPSIRVAYLILPPVLLERYYEVFERTSCTVSRFEQETLRRFLANGGYSAHLRRMNNLYGRRRTMVGNLLSEAFPDGSVAGAEAGLHFLFSLPRFSELELTKKAAVEGVEVHGLSEYCKGGTPMDSTLVLGFAGLDEEAAKGAVERLKRAWKT